MRLLREPLLHFAVLGALVAGGRELAAARVVLVDADRVEALAVDFRLQERREPEPEELNARVEAWVDEELRYREGLALGLDQGDPIVRRRVIQRVELLDRATRPELEPRSEERLYVALEQHFEGPWPHGEDFAARPVEDYASLFGADFVQALREAPVGEWVTLRSVHGEHRVRLGLRELRDIPVDQRLAARQEQLAQAAARRREGVWVWR